jgi:hypothetical protein
LVGGLCELVYELFDPPTFKGNNRSEMEPGHHREEETTMVWPIKRMPEDRIPKLIMEWIPQETRKRGRPRKTWMEGIQAAVTTRYLEPDQWRNREEWNALTEHKIKVLFQVSPMELTSCPEKASTVGQHWVHITLFSAQLN